jgi:hypothetical protein
MHFITPLVSLLALSSATEAMQLRIGRYKFTDGGITQIKPFFKAFDDSWRSDGSEVEEPGVKDPGSKNEKKFCSEDGGFWKCKGNAGGGFQSTSRNYGFRVKENGGSDGAIRVEAWRGTNGWWTWCGWLGRGNVYEDGNEILWQCDFSGL